MIPNFCRSSSALRGSSGAQAEPELVGAISQAPQADRPWWQRLGSAVLVFTLFFSPYGIGLLATPDAMAAPIANPSGPVGFRPQITFSSAGVPVVNITRPNSNGISINQYQAFDIDLVGLILNNSLNNGGSLLGGNVLANPNLSGGPNASLIINEVTSTATSQLNGPLEVFGVPAKVIIANPNGILCNGCGFNSIPNATLLVGRTGFSGATPGEGALHYDIGSGTLRVSGSGIEGTRAQLDLLGGTLLIDGPLRGGETLNLRSGAQRIEASQLLQATVQTPAQTPPGSFGIDATAFGAMNAGQITLIANGAGQGVRSESALVSNTHGLTLSANGDVVLSKTFANTDLKITAGGNLKLNGPTGATRNIDLDAVGAITLDGDLEASGQLNIDAGGNLSQQARTTAIGGGSARAGGDISLLGSFGSAAHYTLNSGRNLYIGETASVQIDGPAQLSSGGQLTQNGSLSVGQGLSIESGGAQTLSGRTTAQGDVRLHSRSTLNLGGTLDTAGSLNASSQGYLGISGRVVSGQDLQLQAGDTLRVDGQLDAGGKLQASTPGALNLGGTLIANGSLSAQAGQHLAVTGALRAPTVSVDGHDGVTVSGQINAQDLTLTSSAGTVDIPGKLVAGGALSLDAEQDISLTGSVAADRLSLKAGGAIDTSGKIVTNDWTLDTAKAFDVSSVFHTVWRNLSLHSDETLSVTQALTLGGTLSLDANQGVSILGPVEAGGQIQLSARSGDIDIQGAIRSAGLSLSGQNLRVSGLTTVVGNAQLDASGQLSLADGTIITGTLSERADTITHQGSLLVGQDLSAQAGQGFTQIGTLDVGGNAQIRSGTTLSLNSATQIGGNAQLSSAGTLQGRSTLDVGKDLSLHTDTGAVQIDGSVLANGRIDARAGGLLQLKAPVASGRDITLVSATERVQTDGDVLALGTLTIAGPQIQAHAALQAGGALNLNADNILLRGPTQTESTLTALATHSLEATAAITATGDIAMRTGDGRLRVADIATGGNLTLSAGTDLQTGTVLSLKDASLESIETTTHTGTVTVAGNLDSLARSIDAQAAVEVGGTARLVADGGDLKLKGISAGSALQLGAQGRLTNAGTLQSGAHVELLAGQDIDQQGAASVKDSLRVLADGKARFGGMTVVGGDYDAQVGQVLQHDSDLDVVGRLNAQAGALDFKGLTRVVGQAPTARVAALADSTANIAPGISLKSTQGDITSQGGFASAQAIVLDSAQDIVLTGSLETETQLSLKAARDIDAQTTGVIGQDLRSEAGRHTALRGSHTVMGQVQIVAPNGDIRLGSLQTPGALQLDAGRDLKIDGELLTPEALSLTAGRDITTAGTLTTGKTLDAQAGQNTALGGTLTVVGDTRVSAAQDALITGTLTTGGDVRLQGGGAAGITGGATLPGKLWARAGGELRFNNLKTAHDVDLDGRGLSFGGDSVLAGPYQLSLNNGDFRNSGQLQLVGDLTLRSTGRFTNSGSLQTGGALDLGFGIVQQYGSLASAGPMNLQARDLLALGGKTQSAQQMTLGAGRVLASGGSETYAQNALKLLTPQLELQGTLGSQTHVQLDVSDYHQTDGAVAGHSVSLNAGQTRIDGGQLTADTALSLNASSLSNAGLLMAGKPAPGQGPNANYLDSLSAPGATLGQLQLNIDGALTNSGQIAATGDITARSANSQAQLTTTATGSWLAGGNIQIDTRQLNQAGSLIAHGQLQVDAQQTQVSGLLGGEAGVRISGNSLSLSGNGQVLAGRLGSGADLLTQLGAPDARVGTLELNLGSLSLQDNSTLISTGELKTPRLDSLSMSAQSGIHTGGDIHLTQAVQQIDGTLTSRKDITLQGQQLTINGTVLAKNALHTESDSLSVGSNGRLEGGQSATIKTTTLANQGVLIGGNTLKVDVPSFNGSGRYLGWNVEITAPGTYTSGLLASVAGHNLSLGGGLRITENQRFVVNGNLSLNGDLTNTAGEVDIGGSLTTTGNVYVQRGPTRMPTEWVIWDEDHWPFYLDANNQPVYWLGTGDTSLCRHDHSQCRTRVEEETTGPAYLTVAGDATIGGGTLQNTASFIYIDGTANVRATGGDRHLLTEYYSSWKEDKKWGGREENFLPCEGCIGKDYSIISKGETFIRKGVVDTSNFNGTLIGDDLTLIGGLGTTDPHTPTLTNFHDFSFVPRGAANAGPNALPPVKGQANTISATGGQTPDAVSGDVDVQTGGANQANAPNGANGVTAPPSNTGSSTDVTNATGNGGNGNNGSTHQAATPNTGNGSNVAGSNKPYGNHDYTGSLDGIGNFGGHTLTGPIQINETLLQYLNTPSGSVYAKNVTLDGDVFRNTGFIFADKITVNADTLQTGKRYADLGNTLSWQDAKHWTLTYGDQIQEGGFMSAADYAFNGEKIICESCTFQRTGESAEQTTQLSADLMTQLRDQYGANLTETELIDRAVHEMHSSVKKGFFQSTLGMVVVIIVAIVLSVVTAGAATAAMAGFVSSAASTAGAAAAAAAAASGATGMACAAAGAAAASAAAATASAITGAIAAAVGAAASSLGTQLLTTGRVNWSSVGKSAVTAGVTAGLTSAVFGASGAASGAQSGAQSTATWGDKVINAGGRAVISAGVNTAVNGGSFGTAVGNAFVTNMGAYAANGIGDYFNSADGKAMGGEGSVGHVISHAAVAGVSAKLTGQDVGKAMGGAAISALAMPVIGDKIIDKLDVSTSTKNLVGQVTAAGLGALVGGQVGSNAAVNTEVNNRQLHTSERQKLREKARAWAQERQGSSGRTPTDQEVDYFYSILEAEASAGVDAENGRKRADDLTKLAATAAPQANGQTLQGAFDAKYYFADVAQARTIIAGMAGDQIVGLDGKPIIADGENLISFSAGQRQYDDHGLFRQSSISDGKEQTISRFVSLDAAKNAESGKSANETRRDERNRGIDQKDRLDRFQVVNGSTTSVVTPVEEVLLATGAKPLMAIAKGGLSLVTRTGEKILGRETGEVAVSTTGKVVAGAEGAGSTLTGGKVTPLSISDIDGPTNFAGPPMSQIPSKLSAGERLGSFGEQQIAKPILEELSPGYRPLQNASGHGSDGIGLANDTTKTIPAFEIKTTDVGNRQAVGDLTQRTANWINEAATRGTITNQRLSPADILFAQNLQQKLAQGYTIQPYVVEVAVPAMGQSARPVVTVIPAPRPTPLPRPKTAPIPR